MLFFFFFKDSGFLIRDKRGAHAQQSCITISIKLPNKYKEEMFCTTTTKL